MSHFHGSFFIWNYRKRREVGRDNLQQIKAEMETVYYVQGKGNAGNDLSTFDEAEFREFSVLRYFKIQFPEFSLLIILLK